MSCVQEGISKKRPMLFNYIYSIWDSYMFRKKFGQSYWPLKNLLSESQYWTEDKMKDYQNNQLKELLEAVSVTTYYSNTIFDFGITNLTVDNITEFRSISKEKLKKGASDLQNPETKKYNIHSTSGSSGDPLRLRVSLNAEAYRRAGRKRYYNWWGINAYDRNVLIWGRSRHLGKNDTILYRAKNFLIKKSLTISVFDLTSETFLDLVKKIKKFRPRFFRGYTSGIEHFADLCFEHKINLTEMKLKGVIVTSEVLFESQRKKIEEVFGCPVINEYGASDGGLIAFECPSGSMHIFEEAILINTTSSGNVLLTDLHNHAMPLINYELGDKVIIAKGGKCKCGRTLKLIERIEGRQGDFIQKSNGEKLSQYFFYYLIKDLDADGFPDCISKYKVIQKENVFDFCYVKGRAFSDKVILHIEHRMISTIGDDIKINFKPVPEIKREDSGKLRFFIRESN